MRSAPALLAQAITQGVVACAGVLDGEVRLVPCSRSNLVHRLDVDGVPVAFGKQQGEATATDGLATVTQEAAVLGALQGGPVPGLLHADEEAVWTTAVPGAPLHETLPRDPLAVAHALGRTLATLHRHPVPATTALPRATRPWPLTGQAPASVRSAPPGSAAAQLAAQVLDEGGEESRVARGAARRWGRRRLVHGDLSADNVLVSWGTTGPVARLVDLEDGGLGEPSWDLVCALRVLDDCLGLADVEAARRALLDSYAAGSGPGVEDPALRLVHDVMADTRSALSDLVSWGHLQQVLAS
ncbi:aminoglycoside phosphotransferase family protein [uncultured Serinicoccus sp.]|uniref:phosphotransferase family protein n=1 Tax=uncultured Serinicoccus sp. TaxID=735514 RepID=UPI0026107BC1|nr:aminoglycoside phosphotransferase family protein [uncultured Serinicoccus sp.]